MESRPSVLSGGYGAAVAARWAGKETEMLRLPGVPHNPFAADLRVRVARAEALLEWMNRHLSGSDAA